ncbi:alkaline phosphatase D family protein [Halopelagius fulvigenes]|uniref:Alkaline phosphatase D family protein n=1 Tax=Halopelagius fulvigenes TaxID=1198324 RepID=A0ABD5TTG3_9EURY
MADNTQGENVTNRREVLRTAGAVAAGGVATALLDADIVRGVSAESVEEGTVDWTTDSDGDAFPLSVASGGPTDAGAILWTKLSEGAYSGSEPTYVRVGTNESFSETVYEGKIAADSVTPDHDHVVKVDLDGELPSDSHLYYQFHHAGANSPVGRCRTLPAPDASPESLRLAVVSCQSYQDGYYPSYGYIAEEDVDYLVHLGDQIYEYAGDSRFEGRSVTLPSGNAVAWTLEDYRHLWRTYRGDEFFQRALARHTFVPTWDDHEYVNNPFWDYENDRPWSDDHPRNDDDEFMTRLYRDSIRVWWEYNPARVEYDADADHLHDRFRMWRSLRFGDLVELLMTDERLFRSMPPGGDDARRREVGVPPNAPEADDGDRTMLGFEQREWFLDTALGSDATWLTWGNEVPFSPIWRSSNDDGQFYRDYDNWDGYEHERREIVGRLAHEGVENYVALTGDMHNYMVSYVLNDWESTENRPPIPSAEERVGVELMAPAISSESDASNFWGAEDSTDVESESPALTADKHREVVLEENPHIEWFDSQYNGYAVAEFTPEFCTWRAYAVDDTVDESDARRTLLREYRIPEGRVELEERAANDLDWED